MKKQDLVNILFTFIVGLFCGVYLYVVGFAPTVELASTAIEEVGEEFVITGEAYGGCDRGGSCPSFNIADNGEYRYSYLPRGGSALALREGVLPLDRQQRLRRYATVAALEANGQPIDPISCESYVDGIDVRYIIAIGDAVYELDSCGTNVDADGALWQELSSLWDYYQVSR